MKKNKKAGNAMLSSISDLLIAGDERIELPPKVLETPIIPFDQSPIYKKKWLLATNSFTLYSQNYIHACWSLIKLFESILTCVPILQRWSSHDSVVRCHLLRKCPVCTINGSPQASLFRPISVTSCPLPRLVGQALTRLVTVSSMCYHTSTSALSTSSSSRGFTS